MKRPMKNATLSFSLLQIFYWMSPGLVAGYVSIYLLDQNYTNTQIGLLIAVAGILSALLQPLVATFADKPSAPSLKILLSAVIVLFLVLVAGMILAYDRAHILTGILFCICMMLRTLMMPMLNALGAETMNEGRPINFGAARGMGSIAYASVSFVLGRIVAAHGIRVVNYAFILFGVLFAAAVLLYPFRKNPETKIVVKGREASNPLTFVSKYPGLLVVLIGCTLLYVCQAQLHSYFYQELESVGGGSAELGIGMAITALCELPPMFGLSLLLKHYSARKLIFIPGIFYALKAFSLFMSTSVTGFYLSQIFQTGSFALITVSSVIYINSVVEEADAIKGQAYMNITYTIGSVIGSASGGFLIDLGGVRTMLFCTIFIALAGSAIIAAGILRRRRMLSAAAA